MRIRKQTIFIAVDQGFAARYLLRTDIFKVLKKSGDRIVILTPNADEDYFIKEFSDENVYIEPIRDEAYRGYSRNVRPKLQAFLRNVRWYVMNGFKNLHTVDTRYYVYKKTRPQDTIKKKFYNLFLDLLVACLRWSKTFRRLEIKLENKLFTPSTHSDLFSKYCPDKMLITSLGYFGFDHYLMREAKAHDVKVISVILSWDNTSSKGMPGAFADYVIAWNETMKGELFEYLDINPDIISVGGIAHFDYHYRKENFWTKDKLYSNFGLNPDRKLIFFAPRSPNKYPWNPEIVEILAKAIEDNKIIYPCQLLVRLHPLNFRIEKGDFRFKEDTARHMAMRGKYKYLIYDIPEILSKKLPMDMPLSEMNKISAILANADVMLNFYSTMMLEASIFNLPIVNVALYTHNQFLDIDDLRVTEFPHIRRIIETGGVRTAYNTEELINLINLYLKNREIDVVGRRAIREYECGYNSGIAGEKIGKEILAL